MDKLLPPKEELDKLLEFVTKNEASDLHLKVGYPPIVRLAGHLRNLQLPPLPDTEYVEAMMAPLIPEGRRQDLVERGSLDFSACGATGDRFRINMYRSTGDTHVALRRVQSQIPDFETLNLPDVYRETIEKTYEGLVLVCGVTGCGKSSTLAAMLDYINQHRSMHFITVEDPIEFAFQPKMCIISQREVGLDVPSFADALRSVVRQDPDGILVGEMRDRETMLAGLQAAETGHLVLGSLHCSDAQQSFARILEFFPRDEHAFIRSSMSNSLKAIMVQRLVPATEEGTRLPATEVLLNNAIMRDKVLREEDSDIPAVMSQCREEGMRTFTDSLCELVQAERITRETALEYAPSRDALISKLRGIETSGQSLMTRVRHPSSDLNEYECQCRQISRRWQCVRLRTAFVVLTIICLWLAQIVREASWQRAAVELVHRAGGTVRYDYQIDELGGFRADAKLPGPEWVQENAGLEYLVDIDSVHLTVNDRNREDVDVALCALSKVNRLRLLRLFGADDDSLLRVARLKQLRHLTIASTNITDVRPLRSLRKLHYLRLACRSLTDDGLATVGELSRLEELNLACCPQLTNVSLTYIGRLKGLRTLCMTSNHVDGSGLAEISALQHLKTLRLNLSRIGDGALDQLQEMDSLREVSLKRTQVTKNGARQLAQALPRCAVLR